MSFINQKLNHICKKRLKKKIKNLQESQDRIINPKSIDILIQIVPEVVVQDLVHHHHQADNLKGICLQISQ